MLQVDLGLLALLNGLRFIVLLLLERLGCRIELDLLVVGFFLILLSLLNLRIYFLKLLHLGVDGLLRRSLPYRQGSPVFHVAFELLALLIFALRQVLPFLVFLPELGLLRQLNSLLTPAFRVRDLSLQYLNLGTFLLFFFLAASFLHLLIVDLFLKVCDFLDLLVGHAQCAAHILCLLPDLVDLGLALGERLLLLVVGALKHMVLGLILLFECAQVLVADDLVKESLEFAFDLLKGIRVETELINSLELFGLVRDSSNIELDIIIVCHFSTTLCSLNSN